MKVMILIFGLTNLTTNHLICLHQLSFGCLFASHISSYKCNSQCIYNSITIFDILVGVRDYMYVNVFAHDGYNLLVTSSRHSGVNT